MFSFVTKQDLAEEDVTQVFVELTESKKSELDMSHGNSKQREGSIETTSTDVGQLEKKRWS